LVELCLARAMRRKRVPSARSMECFARRKLRVGGPCELLGFHPLEPCHRMGHSLQKSQSLRFLKSNGGVRREAL
jgi:hypothetical protein